MKSKEFDVEYWENIWETVPLPQEEKRKSIHEFHQIFMKYLPKEELKLIEIGCAPGSWLAYFNRHFRYFVSGIEYAPKAYDKTVENLSILNIPNEVFWGDFFKFVHEPFDIVFSAGFVEHFEDVAPVVAKIADLCKSNGGMVITIIPNMMGIDRFISKTFRPHVAAGHFPITKNELVNYHEQCGLETICCKFVGSLHILSPMGKNVFSGSHPLISALLNLPFRVWNRIVSISTRKLGIYPQIPHFSKSIIYIGKKNCGETQSVALN